MAFKFNIWSIVTVLFLCYMGNSLYQLYLVYFPNLCHENKRIDNAPNSCLDPAMDPGRIEVQLRLYQSVSSALNSASLEKAEVLRQNRLNFSSSFEKTVAVSLPRKTRDNGTLYLFIFLLPTNFDLIDPRRASWYLERKTSATTYSYPVAETINLLNSNKEDEKQSKERTYEKLDSQKPVTHFRSVLPLMGVGDKFSFLWKEIPGEISSYLQLDPQRRYLPIFGVNELNFRLRDLIRVDKNLESVNLTVKYEPISIGKLRLLHTAKHSTDSLTSLGFTEKDIDEVKGIFTDTNFYFLALTFAIAALHLLLDFLAFKNDINFWRKRKTMVGISTRTLLWRCFSQSVVFLYLLDENTSLLISVPTGLGVLIELWKLTKAFKIKVVFVDKVPKFQIGCSSEAETETADFDSQGMRYLAYILTPLCLAGAAYSLLYVPHKSWYSWFVQSLANAVYAFGFLFMLPQLFINYKLKSVAHLPWRAFTYKAFNTFIDDLFAFIISMPTAHRVACFRDDIVFVVYLYQRFLYPVDKSRVNEYGEAFDQDADEPKTNIVLKSKRKKE